MRRLHPFNLQHTTTTTTTGVLILWLSAFTVAQAAEDCGGQSTGLAFHLANRFLVDEDDYDENGKCDCDERRAAEDLINYIVGKVALFDLLPS